MLESAPTAEAEPKALEIRASFELSEEEKKIIHSHSDDLAAICGLEDQINAKIIFAGKESWDEAAKELGVGSKKYRGSSIEVPLSLDGVPSVLLPGPDVFDADSQAEYKKGFELSPKLKEAIANEPRKVFEVIYSRDIAAHELAHLYQFSSSQLGSLASLSREPVHEDSETGKRYSDFDVEYSKELPLREFTSCLYGLQRMIELGADSEIVGGFIEANELAGRDLGPGYMRDQAQRTVTASKMLDLGWKRRETATLFRLCRSEDTNVRKLATTAVEAVVVGDVDPQGFIETIRKIEAGLLQVQAE